MKIKKYTNGTWTDLDKPVKKFDTYTDEATTLPLTIQTSATDAVENYQVYGASGGVGEETENMHNTQTDFLDYRITWATGALIQSQGSSISDYIPVVEGQTYSTNTALDWIGYNSQQTYLGAWYSDANAFVKNGYVSQIITLTIPNGCQYIRLLRINSYMSNVNFVKGSTAPTTYIPFGYKIPILNTSGNLFDYTAKDENKGYKNKRYLNYLGKINYNDYWRVSEYIEITPNTNYRFHIGTKVSTNPAVCWYNEQKEFISGDIYGQRIFSEFQSPSNAKYLRMSYYFDSISRYPEGENTECNALSNYDLFVGDSKLYADEYLDFESQKVYKYVDGVLTPQDPPISFPTLTTYIGENNISVDTTVQPEKVACEYQGWKGVGDVEKYQNGEWSDNNGT